MIGGSPYLSNNSAVCLQSAAKISKSLKDEFVTVEHILIALASGSDEISKLMKSFGLTEKTLKKVIQELRGGDTVKDQNAESKYQSLNRYSKKFE